MIATSTFLGFASFIQIDRRYTVDVLNSIVIVGLLLCVYVREMGREGVLRSLGRTSSRTWLLHFL